MLVDSLREKNTRLEADMESMNAPAIAAAIATLDVRDSSKDSKVVQLKCQKCINEAGKLYDANQQVASLESQLAEAKSALDAQRQQLDELDDEVNQLKSQIYALKQTQVKEFECQGKLVGKLQDYEALLYHANQKVASLESKLAETNVDSD
jgi:chromosome segregation ATPase